MVLKVTVQNSRELSKYETRLLLFPDGVERLITMTRRYWGIMLWLAENDGSATEQESIDIAYQIATEFHDPKKMSFEDAIRECMHDTLIGGIMSVMRYQNDLIQDNSETAQFILSDTN